MRSGGIWPRGECEPLGCPCGGEALPVPFSLMQPSIRSTSLVARGLCFVLLTLCAMAPEARAQLTEPGGGDEAGYAELPSGLRIDWWPMSGPTQLIGRLDRGAEARYLLDLYAASGSLEISVASDDFEALLTITAPDGTLYEGAGVRVPPEASGEDAGGIWDIAVSAEGGGKGRYVLLVRGFDGEWARLQEVEWVLAAGLLVGQSLSPPDLEGEPTFGTGEGTGEERLAAEDATWREERARQAYREAERARREAAMRSMDPGRPRRPEPPRRQDPIDRSAPADPAVGERSDQAALFPSIGAPSAVPPDLPFLVHVMLSTERRDRRTIVEQGDVLADGALNMEAGEYQAYLFAFGFSVQEAIRPLLVQEGEAVNAAQFQLTPLPLPSGVDGQMRKIEVHLMREGAFVAEFWREICVGTCAPESSLRAVPGQARGVSPPTPEASTSRPVLPSLAPDLTITMMYDPWHTPESGEPQDVQVMVRRRTGLPRSDTWREPVDTEAWISEQYTRLASLGARGPEGRRDSARARATAEGIGMKLWRDYVPDLVQEEFWALVDESGGRPLAIQIISNDVSLPWELMLPIRDGAPFGFLGIQADLGRWHAGSSPPRKEVRPGQEVEISGLTLVAPEYPNNPLPAQARERAALQQWAQASDGEPTFSGLASLLAVPDRQILHFAGHGQARADVDGSTTQVVILEDDERIDLRQWEALLAQAPEAPPFVFFNACEIGQTERSGGYVSGWAATMLDAGVTGYVGALWRVNDDAAADFAAAFYRHLYRPSPNRGQVAFALRSARAELYTRTRNPTHLAYAYYGDPLQRLVLPE